ncbi:MAG: aspartyl/asparaginyl beta-hydroxylase domain-containing protein [Pseudomonadota bacterium]
MKHLFICIPNNSGSSLVSKLVGRSSAVAVLPDEGQHVDGYVGPIPRELGVVHFYSECDAFTDSASYDWPEIRRVWNEHWDADDAAAAVRVEKSPPNVVRMDMLDAEFPEANFVISWRNPYAMAEGILRNNWQARVSQAARHAIRMLERARKNIERFGERSVAMSYEELTAQPQTFLNRLRELLPELGELRVDSDREIVVKGSRYSGIRDRNAEQIANLSPLMIRQLNLVFEHHIAELEHFGYELLDESAGRGGGFRPAPLLSRTRAVGKSREPFPATIKGDFDFDFLGCHNGVEALASQVQKLYDEWHLMTYRQDQFGPHVDTHTTPILWVDPPEFDVVHEHGAIGRHHEDLFGEHIAALEDRMSEHYGPGYFLRLILTRLPPGKEIPRHVDRGRSFAVSHRVHMAVITDPSITFEVNGSEKTLRAGELWEINNFRPHAVRNGSGIDRVHLIGDWHVPDEGPLDRSMAARRARQGSA